MIRTLQRYPSMSVQAYRIIVLTLFLYGPVAGQEKKDRIGHVEDFELGINFSRQVNTHRYVPLANTGVHPGYYSKYGASVTFSYKRWAVDLKWRPLGQAGYLGFNNRHSAISIQTMMFRYALESYREHMLPYVLAGFNHTYTFSFSPQNLATLHTLHMTSVLAGTGARWYFWGHLYFDQQVGVGGEYYALTDLLSSSDNYYKLHPVVQMQASIGFVPGNLQSRGMPLAEDSARANAIHYQTELGYGYRTKFKSLTVSNFHGMAFNRHTLRVGFTVTLNPFLNLGEQPGDERSGPGYGLGLGYDFRVGRKRDPFHFRISAYAEKAWYQGTYLVSSYTKPVVAKTEVLEIPEDFNVYLGPVFSYDFRSGFFLRQGMYVSFYESNRIEHVHANEWYVLGAGKRF